MNQIKNIAVKIVKAGAKPIIQIENVNQAWSNVVLTPKQFIAQVDYAPLNPLDISKIRGDLELNVPFVPGSECNGTIVKAYDEKLVGKKVCFFALEGSWKSFALGNEEKCIEISEINERNCNLLVNPFTAQGLMDKIKNYDCFINSAANSALGQILIKLAKRENKKVINIVRTEKRIEELKQNSEYNISLEDVNFDKKLKELIDKLNCKVFLDCYGGELGGRIMKLLPFSGVMINYGSLISKCLQIDAVDVRFKDKKLEGFNLFNYMNSNGELKKKFAVDVQNNNELYYQKVQQVIQVQNEKDVEEGLQKWSQSQDGKIIFKFN